MKKENEVHKKNETINSEDPVEVEANETADTSNEEVQAVSDDTANGEVQAASEEKNDLEKEIESLKEQLNEKTKQCEQYFDMLQRNAAEFDNFRKRTLKEKEAIYSDTAAEIAASFLPVVDNFERAMAAVKDDNEQIKPLRNGVELVYKQLMDVLKNLGVEEIKCVGSTFNPELHNAVMHIEDEAYGENVIVEEFLKGYTLKGRVIRYSMVKVAN